MHDNLNMDNSIQATSGPNSPVVSGNNNTTTVVVNRPADMRTTPVEFIRGRPSWINSRSAQMTAWVATVFSCAISVFTLLWPTPFWQGTNPSTESLSSSWPVFWCRIGILVAVTFVLIRVWRFALRHRRAQPKIGRRWSPFRSLIPVDRAGSRYQRVTARARCSRCWENSRDEWGTIVHRGRGRHRWIAYRCRLGHVTGFLADSLFIE